jgi:c-di-GMP-binding flagellar brake protein YcgR
MRDSDGLTPIPDAHERRAYSRQKVDSKAVIFLINAGGQLRGRLLDLSLNGCRVKSDERSPVSTHTRVNVELLLDGLLFRLNGVIEANEDQRILRIRFEETSGRQREQVGQLMERMQTLDLE